MGYQVTYVVPEEFEEFLTRQLFNVFIYEKPVAARPRSYLKRLRTLYINARTRDQILKDYSLKLVMHFKPVLILIDSDVPRYAAVLKDKANLVMYSTTLGNSREANIPPYFSSYIPVNNLLSVLYVKAIWQLWLIKKQLYFLKYELLSLGHFDHSLKRYCRKNNLNKKTLDIQRAWPTGFRDLPELLFYPREFDFNKTRPTKNKYYLGPMVDLSRVETGDFAWDKIQFRKYLVCCSMGTLARFHYKGIDSFYNVLIQAVKNQEHITLLIAGSGKDPVPDIDHAENVFLFPKLPLLNILKRCDLFINHAGINSVKEAILTGVPMLLLPLNNQTDQNGVAARCVFHGIAKRRNIRKISPETLAADISDLVTNPHYKTCVHRLQKIFNDAAVGMDALLQQVQQKTINS